MRKNTKTIFVMAVLFILLAVGCSTTVPAEQTKLTDVAEAVKAAEAAPAAVPAAEPVAEPAAEPVAEPAAEPEETGFQYDYYFEYAGYEIDIEAHDGYGYVTYPSFITDAQLIEAATAFVSAHGPVDAVISKVAPGKLEVKYAEGLTKADFDYLANLAANDLTWYLNTMFATAEPETEPVVEPAAAPVVPVKKSFQYDYHFDYAGYAIDIEVHNGYGYVTYPSFITDAQLVEAAKAFVSAHGTFGVSVGKVAPGKLEVKFAEDLTKADFDYIANLAASDLAWYLNSMFAKKGEKPEEIKVEVKVEVKEEPVVVVEEKVEEVKTVEPVVTTTTTTATTTTATTTTVSEPAKVEVKETPAPAKKKGMPAILVILIILVVIAAALYCFFCLYKKLSVKDALETIKKFFVDLYKKIFKK